MCLESLVSAFELGLGPSPSRRLPDWSRDILERGEARLTTPRNAEGSLPGTVSEPSWVVLLQDRYLRIRLTAGCAAPWQAGNPV